jgi:hypothetical protein
MTLLMTNSVPVLILGLMIVRMINFTRTGDCLGANIRLRFVVMIKIDHDFPSILLVLLP